MPFSLYVSEIVVDEMERTILYITYKYEGTMYDCRVIIDPADIQGQLNDVGELILIDCKIDEETWQCIIGEEDQVRMKYGRSDASTRITASTIGFLLRNHFTEQEGV